MKYETFPGIHLDFDTERIHEVEIPTVTSIENGHERSYGEVMFMGDLHIGHESFSESHLVKYLNLIKSKPNIRVVGMGDYFEAEEFTDYYLEQETRLKYQLEKFLGLFKPVSDRMVAMVYGNHDERFARASKGSVDLLDYVKLKLGNEKIITTPPQRGVILVFKSGDFYYPTYVCHSATRAIVRTDAQFRRTSMNWLVPLICHGHTHQMSFKFRTFFSVSRVNGVFYRSIFRQYWLSTGSFLRYPSYAERLSYPVCDIGAPIIRFHADTYEIEYVDPRVHYKDYIVRGGAVWERAKVDVSDILPIVRCTLKR